MFKLKSLLTLGIGSSLIAGALTLNGETQMLDFIYQLGGILGQTVQVQIWVIICFVTICMWGTFKA